MHVSSDCELVALLEDDTGMELLICNKIISLDLPVKDVYKKIWCSQQNVRRGGDGRGVHVHARALFVRVERREGGMRLQFLQNNVCDD